MNEPRGAFIVFDEDEAGSRGRIVYSDDSLGPWLPVEVQPDGSYALIEEVKESSDDDDISFAEFIPAP